MADDVEFRVAKSKNRWFVIQRSGNGRDWRDVSEEIATRDKALYRLGQFKAAHEAMRGQ